MWRILAVAFLVSIATALVEIAVNDFVDRTNLPLSILGALTASGVSILGAVFLSGFLCRLVGETELGKEGTSVRQVLRTLPWFRLIRADILVAVLVVVGLIALVIPGLVAVNLFAVVGPVIEIENRPVIAALRRSAHLVRLQFWKVALLATLPVILASEIDSISPDHLTSAGAILEVLAIRGLAEAVVEAGIGLMLVELCYRLIALDRRQADAEGKEPAEEPAAEGEEPGQPGRHSPESTARAQDLAGLWVVVARTARLALARPGSNRTPTDDDRGPRHRSASAPLADVLTCRRDATRHPRRATGVATPATIADKPAQIGKKANHRTRSQLVSVPLKASSTTI